MSLLITINSVAAETKSDGQSQHGSHHTNLTAAKAVQDIPTRHQVSTSAQDLLAQQIPVTRVTGVKVKQTNKGLEVILTTASGGQRLVPLILPEGKNLVIDILDATLGFSIRNGVTKTNPAPGIKTVKLAKVDESSIRLTITGSSKAPSAEIVPSRQNLVLSVTPEGNAVQTEPDEEIEIIATGQAEEDDYYVPDAGVTRTDTPIIDTPASVQVIPRQVFEDQNATNFSDALRSAAGVNQANSSRDTFTNVLIRGFDSTATLLKNGIPEAFRNFTPPQDLTNVERLEVLSGPASITGGQIAPGGIINIVTKQPLSSPFYELSASYGSFNTYQGAFDFSGPLNSSKTLSYRLNASLFHSDTYYDLDDVELDRFSIAPVISWQIGEKTKLTFEGMYLNPRVLNGDGKPAIGTVLDNPNGEVPRERYLGEGEYDNSQRKILQAGYDLTHSFDRDWSIRHTFRYSELTRIDTGVYLDALQDDLRTLERSAGRSDFTLNNFQTTTYLTGKFDTGNINHQILFGIDYLYEEYFRNGEDREVSTIDLFNPVYSGVGEIIPGSSFRDASTLDGFGIYLQDQLQMFDDRLILVLGGRLDFVGSSSEEFGDEPVQTSQDNSAFSPKVGLLYKIADNVSIYGSFSRSFEQEIGNSFDNEIFEPSRGTQYEIGVKGNWLDNRLSTTLALYDLTKSNVSTTDPENIDFSIQTGEQSSQGIELVTTGEILPGWNVIASYAYTDAKISKDNEFAVGNRLDRVPENAASLWTTYTIPKGNLQGLGFGFGLFYVGEREGDLDNSFQLPDYLRTDAAVYYRRENLNLAFNVNNLFDIDYFEASDNDLNVYAADPLTVEFSASYKF